MTRPKAMPKAIPPPSPSSSGSESEASSSDDDEENHHQQQQQQQQAKEAARAKASPSPVKKKPVVVPEQQQSVVPRERMASPPPAKKKSVLKNNKKPPPPVPPPPAPAADADADSSDEEASDSPPKAKPTPSFSRPRDVKPSRSTEPTSLSKPEVPTIADADASSSDEEASDSSPKAKPTPSYSRPRDLKPSRSTESTSFSKPEVPTPAAASQQSHKGKERKRQREEAGGKQEGDAAAVGGSSSNKPFQRVWTVENEMALLKSMLDFKEKHGVPLPAKITDAFFEFISLNLQGDFSKIQLYTKIRALRKRYERNLHRGKKDADPSFAKPHEQVAFEISKKLWPIAEGDAHDYRGNRISVNTKDGGRKTGDQGASLLYPSLTEAINLLGKEDDNSFLAQTASRALESLKSTKLKALEDRWSKHFIAGVNYLMERAKLKKDLLQSLVEIIDSE